MRIKIIDDTFYPGDKNGTYNMIMLFIITFGISAFLPSILNIMGWVFLSLGMYGLQRKYFERRKKK